jgi:hypothetical protein
MSRNLCFVCLHLAIAIRIFSLVTVGSTVLLACSSFVHAQDPPVRDLRDSQDAAPIPRSLSAIPDDDPIMQAIRERAGLAPKKDSHQSDTSSQTVRKSADRWRIAERLLRQARMMERDANSLEQLGDLEAASALRQIVATTREQAVRTLQAAAKPVEEKLDGNLPSKTTKP